MNKFYIQIGLFLLSIFTYANNETLATEPAPGTAAKPSRFATPEEIYEKNKDIECRGHDHTSVINIMNDAVKHLKYYATSKGGYEVYP
ncbi:fam-a protein, fragment [Plasmodium vinckei vinckei]|uniref:Fam-a protein n=1 Tax=Plasmodium vinckei vinckei TaxID=54757 RepID=A0A449BZP1_PLAVN|nr:fam-a protein, fragment [Plasmodium vinckei vinckei]KEG04419.1 hypothetical protein YYE_01325 [Plasmodium vinckei vinckei]VEV58779.1 fam-a protein, fragment [Plasmodium vinckei vinckei]